MLFILCLPGTKASNHQTFTWETLRFLTAVATVVWDTEWVRLNCKGFARPLSHWQVPGHKVTSLLWGVCWIRRRNKHIERGIFGSWMCGWVSMWIGLCHLHDTVCQSSVHFTATFLVCKNATNYLACRPGDCIANPLHSAVYNSTTVFC